MRLTRAALVIGLLQAGAAWGQDEAAPACLQGNGRTPEEVLAPRQPSSEQLLARLVYAEGISTGFADEPLVHRAIAWGVMNRVRLAEVSEEMARRLGRGVRGVVFKKGQFNPAVSRRSPFSRDFLCPSGGARWSLAVAAARRALRGEGNPFIVTEWELRHRLSLVINFYYPASIQARGPLAPWERDGRLDFIGPVAMGDGTLGPERVRFYRLARPPADVATGPGAGTEPPRQAGGENDVPVRAGRLE